MLSLSTMSILLSVVLADELDLHPSQDDQMHSQMQLMILRDTGGAYRDRTDDLLNANQALSQLS